LNILPTALAAIISVGIPAIFLALIYGLDFYASRSFKLVLLCAVWGATGAFTLAVLINTYTSPAVAAALGLDPYFFLVVFLAPPVEEIAKSMWLIFFRRRTEFTYFVEGAIYGFAAGIGFSILENFLYMSQNPGTGIALVLTRAFSTCLMHGTAAGLVGVAVGYFRFGKKSGQTVALIGGWIAAIALHSAFNAAVHAAPLGDALVVVLAVAIGLAGVGMIVLFITLGLGEERKWLEETLDREVGVSAAEMRAAQAYGSLDEVMKPIVRQFPRKAEQVERLLLKQAQIGIKRKVLQRVQDPQVRERLEGEITRLRAEMEALRKEVGLCVMTYVRSVFPAGALDIWGSMELLTACSGPPDLRQWVEMLATDVVGSEQRSIFSAAQQRVDEEDKSAG